MFTKIKNLYDKDDSAGMNKIDEQNNEITTDVEDKTITTEEVPSGLELLNYDDIDLKEADNVIDKQVDFFKNPVEEKPAEESKPVEEQKTEKIQDDRTAIESTVKPVEGESNVEPDSSSVRINDEYISKQPEDVQVILKSIKGKRDFVDADPQMLKNYIHAEKHIVDLKAGKTETPQQTKVEEKPNMNDYLNFTPEESNVIENAVRQEIVAQYPELRGEDDQGIKSFLTDLNQTDPREAAKFIRIEDDARQRITQYVQQYKYISTNHDTVVKSQISKAHELVKEKIAKMYGLDADTLLKNPQFNFTELGENKSNPLLETLAKDQNAKKYLGVGKSALVMYNPNAIASNFIEYFGTTLANIARAEATSEGFRKALERKEVIKAPPSLSNSNQRQKIVKDQVSDFKVNYDMTPEEMETVNNKLIEKMKHNH